MKLRQMMGHQKRLGHKVILSDRMFGNFTHGSVDLDEAL